MGCWQATYFQIWYIIKKKSMALNVNSAFNKFCDSSVNLQKSQVSQARRSREWLIGNIKLLADRKLIPPVFGDMTIKFGSFARSTKIRPLDDIDLMLCYRGCGGVYNIVEVNKTYTITFNSPVESFKGLCEDNVLNSRKIVENLKMQLANLSGYSQAEIHRNQEAVTLKLSSYPWNFDIVPCFVTTSDFYLIPDGNGNWKNTDPRIDNRRTTEANQRHQGKVLQWIRIMKYWRALDGNPWKAFPSYVFEQMLLDITEQLDFNQSMSKLVESTLSKLPGAAAKPIMDPKDIQGNLNTVSADEYYRMVTYAENHAIIAKQAIFEEYCYNAQLKAINDWKEILGSVFPFFS